MKKKIISIALAVLLGFSTTAVVISTSTVSAEAATKSSASNKVKLKVNKKYKLKHNATLYSAPSNWQQCVKGILKKGTIVKIKSFVDKDFVSIVTNNGKVGFIYKSNLL